MRMPSPQKDEDPLKAWRILLVGMGAACLVLLGTLCVAVMLPDPVQGWAVLIGLLLACAVVCLMCHLIYKDILAAESKRSN
jgi:hypothetical protein